jgi:hypothetical protein
MRSETKEKGATSLCSAQVLITQSSCTSVWFIDSGASHHFCTDKHLLDNLTNSNLDITMGDNHCIKSKSKRTISLRELSIEAYFVPQFRVSLLSVSQLAKDGYKTTFTDNLCNISKGGKLILRVRETNSLYQVDLLSRALVTTRSMARHPATASCNPPAKANPDSLAENILTIPPQVLSPPAIQLNDIDMTPGEPRKTCISDSIEL